MVRYGSRLTLSSIRNSDQNGRHTAFDYSSYQSDHFLYLIAIFFSYSEHVAPESFVLFDNRPNFGFSPQKYSHLVVH